MYCKNHNKTEQAEHHDLGNSLDTVLDADTADENSGGDRDDHKERHFTGIAEHVRKDIRDNVGFNGIELSGQEFHEIIQHPAGDRCVVHHQQIASGDAEPAVNMPLAALRLERLVALDHALAACAADSQLHRKDRSSHDDEEEKIKEDEYASSVLSCHEREFPDISDTDGTARGDEQKAKPRFETFSLHFVSPF